MINAYLSLRIGLQNKGRFVASETFDMEIDNYSSETGSESVNGIFSAYNEPAWKHAELRLHIAGIDHDGFIIAQFQKIKLKNKGYKWIVVE